MSPLRTATLLLVLSAMICLPAAAQRKCGTAEVLQLKLKSNPALQRKMQSVETELQRPSPRIQARGAAVVTIPIVVHIVLPNPDLVTDAQVMSQLAVLNSDYMASNADLSKVPAAWQSIIGDAQVQFCLAQRTPTGDPTNGIIRTVTSSSGFNVLDNSAADVKYDATGGDDAWDYQRYLNIWVCSLTNGYLGVATPPGNLFPAAEEGIVVSYRAFGNTGAATAPYNKGRTATHEIGHFFGLIHIWGDDNGSCSGSDNVNDTPPQANNTYNCPSFPVTDACSPTTPGIMFMNYMDYTDDACMYMFTAGQAARMQNALASSSRVGLLTSDGCAPVNLKTQDAGIEVINTPMGKVCVTGQTPVVQLKNKGTAPLTAVTISYQVDNGTPVTQTWIGNLASLQTANVQLGSFNTTEGSHTIRVYSSAPNGGVDQDQSNDTANTIFHYDNEAGFPYTEGFETATFPPYGWSINNSDNSFTWELSDEAKTGQHSVVMRNLGYAANGPVDELLSPVFDGGNNDSLFLFFDIAAAAQSNVNTAGNNVWDTLQVLLTTDCGTSYIDLGYKKWGKTLVTRAVPTPGEFIPASSEWRRDSIDLTKYARNTKFRVVFRNTTNYENNIYLDNINLVTREVNPNLKEKGVLVRPNPFSSMVYVEFYEYPDDLESVGVYNVLGRLVRSVKQASLVNNRYTFDLVNEPNGVYFVKLFYKNKVRTFKIVKVQ